MEGEKITVTITVEVLSIECVSQLIKDALNQIDNEKRNGSLIAADGDTVKWETKSEKVKF